jgi:5'-3' exonuclease
VYNHIVIDVLNCYFRNITGRKISKLKYQGKEIVTSGINGSIESINRFEKEFLFSGGTVWLLFDNPNSITELRKDIDPEYKNQRELLTQEFIIGIRILKDILKIYKDNYRIICIDKAEADDLVLPLVNYIDKKEDILLISNDLDWARCINANIHWYNWDKLFYLEEFKRTFGFSPEGNKVQLYKSLRGDKSDNIPNPFFDKDRNINWRMPEQTILEIVNKYSDLDDFYKDISNYNLTDEWKKRFKLVEARIRLNYSLVSFLLENIEDFDKYIQYCKFNKIECKLWYKTLGFKLEDRMSDNIIDDLFKHQEVERN